MKRWLFVCAAGVALAMSFLLPVLAGGPNASVMVRFDGLQLLAGGDEGRITAALLDAPPHKPVLTVTRVMAGTKTIVTTLEGEQLRGSLAVEVEGSSHPLERYQAASREEDLQDWRWVLSLDEMYPGKTFTIQEEKLFGKVHFIAGLFHAGDLSQTPARFFSTQRNGKALPLKRRIARPAASIDLNPGEILVIRSVDEREKQTQLRFEVKEGVSYELSLTNLPPPDKASFDHFIHYFEIIKEPLPRYVPVYAFKTAFDPFPHACGPVNTDKTKLRFP